MRKIGLILACCLLMSNIFAQSAYHKYDNKHTSNQHISQIEEMVLGQRNIQYIMTGFHTDDNYQISHFYWDNGGGLIACYDEIVGEYKVYDSLRYNAAGQMVRLEGWQWLNNQWKNVYYIDYTYNEAGKIASRTNYNLLGNEWTLGGIYEYNYNAEGQIVNTELTLGGMLYQTIDYTYENGLLKEEIWSNADFNTGILQPEEKYTYEYTNGKLTTMLDSMYDYGWYYDGHEEFEYDNNGNCTLHQVLDQNDDVVEKSIYEYDSRLLINTMVPIHPELYRPKYFTNSNLVATEHWYTLDVDHVLQYVCDYIYEYDNSTSVEEHQNDQALVCYPNPANNYVTVSGVENADVVLYDMSGRVVYQGIVNNNGQINVSNLPEGNYVLQANENGKTRVARVVVTR